MERKDPREIFEKDFGYGDGGSSYIEGWIDIRPIDGDIKGVGDV